MSQPPARRLQAPRPKQRLRYLLCLSPSVVTPARYGVSTRPERRREFRTFTSAGLRRVGRWKIESGRWGRFSFTPEMPRYRSTLS